MARKNLKERGLMNQKELSLNEKIGLRIAKLREWKMLTQDELAKALKTNRSSINMWERGERELKAGDIQIFADYFNVTSDFLIYGREAQNIDIFRATGLSQTAIEALKQFKKEDVLYSTDGEAFDQGRCCSLSVALSCPDFLHSVASHIMTKSSESGYHDEAVFNEEEGYWVGRLSPDMYAAVSATRITFILESLRRGDGKIIPEYPPWTREMESYCLNDIHDHNTEGAKNGEEGE